VTQSYQCPAICASVRGFLIALSQMKQEGDLVSRTARESPWLWSAALVLTLLLLAAALAPSASGGEEGTNPTKDDSLPRMEALCTADTMPDGSVCIPVTTQTLTELQPPPVIAPEAESQAESKQLHPNSGQ
jgi:hypothetical protein